MKSTIALAVRGLALLVLSLAWLHPAPAATSAFAEPSFQSLQVETPDYEFTATGIEVPGYALHEQPGAPRLPLRGLTFELPLAGNWELTFESSGSRILDERIAVAAAPVPDLDLNTPIAPQDWATPPSHVPVVDRPDPAIYAVDAFYPASPVLVGEPVQQGDKRLLPVRVFPFQYNPITQQVRYHPDLTVRVDVQPSGEGAAPAAPDGFYQPTALPGEGTLRVHTREQGLYRLTYTDLGNAGVAVGPGGENPNSFAIYYKGQQVDTLVTGAGDGSFDPGDLVIFYAVPYDGGRFQNYNVYQFVYGDGVMGQRIAPRPVTASIIPTTATVVTQTLHVEYDRDYRSLYPRPSYADHFFDTQLFVNTTTPTVTRSYDLALDDALTGAGVVQLSVLVHGGVDQVAAPDQSVALRLNSYELGVYPWDGSVDKSITATVPATWLDSSPNRVHLTAALSQLPALPPPPAGGSPYYWISPDWVRVSYPALADAEGDRILIAAMPPPTSHVAVSGFTTPTVTALDVSDPAHPLLLQGVGVQGGSGAYLLHWDETLAGRSYVLSSEAALLAPGAVERDTPSNWADADNAFDYVAIVGNERTYAGSTALGGQLAAAVQPLLDHRAAEGFSVALVHVQDIYDEWSYGRIDPMAIRSFLSHAYFTWQTPPRYVLLVGDGHYDYNKVTTQPLPMLVPPYLIDIDPFIGETAADNRYVSIDGPSDYLPNMAIGRMPVNFPADVTAMVNKTLIYEDVSLNPSGLWQQKSVYVADDCADPSGNFHALSDFGRLQWLPTAYAGAKIYYDNPNNPIVCPMATHSDRFAMRSTVRQSFSDGALFLHWFGHGSQARWGGSASLFQANDNPAMIPSTRSPFSMASACMTGYFVWHSPYSPYPYMQSLAEVMVITPERSSVADFSPSGLHVGSALLTLNQGVHVGLFQERIPRAGDVADFSRFYFFQNSFTWHDLIDTMVFFGDPALKLRYPTGDLASSTLAVSDAVAPLGASLHYTLTIRNTSIFTTSQPLVTVDYPQGLVAVEQASGAVNNGDTLRWTLPDLPAASQQVVTFTLRAENMPPPESYDLAVPATVSSQMAPSVALEAHTQILTPPDALASGLAVQREWLPPGFPVTATLTLTHSGDLPAPGVLVTMTLPAELGAPTWLSATTASLVYDPVAHRITWNGDAPVGGPTLLAFSSVISPSLTACAVLPLDAAVTYRNATTPQSAQVNLAVPDVDCSGGVTVVDIQQVAARWGALGGDPLYHPRYDLDASDMIDVLDITAAAQVWN